MAVTTRPITYEDSLRMPENKLEEVVRGESRIMPPPADTHGYLLIRLTRLLDRQLLEEEYAVLGPEFGLGIERSPVLTYRIPDRMVFRASVLRQDRQEKDGGDPYIWKAPELIVECLSPANRKGPLEELLADYARIGVPEVWLFDPKKRRVQVFEYADGSLRLVEEATAGTLTSRRLPRVGVELDALWDAYDRGLF